MKDLQEKAINSARGVLFSNCGYSADKITTDKMFIVWFCKTLQNWKAIVGGTDIKELIEVTYNGDKNEVYVDVYGKKLNTVVTL
jgi:conserved domain protein